MRVKKRRAEKMKQTEWDAVHSMHSFKLNLIKKNKMMNEKTCIYEIIIKIQIEVI